MVKANMFGAINAALLEEMRRDDRVFIMGEYGNEQGTPNMIASGVHEEFGEERSRRTPLSETAIAGCTASAALGGMRPVAHMGRADFMTVALDEITAKAGLWRGMHGGVEGLCIPAVFLGQFGGGAGWAAEHSRAPLAWFMHAPGLKVVVPSGPYDAKGLFKTAVRDNNPVVFLSHAFLNRPMFAEEIPEEEYLIPFGLAKVVREGSDVTVVGTAYQLKQVLNAATELEKEGISLEVIDPRTLEPFDIETIVKSIRKTNRAVVVDEDHRRCGIGAEIVCQIYENAFDSLDAPVIRIGAENIPIPASRVLEDEMLPQIRDIMEAARTVLGK